MDWEKLGHVESAIQKLRDSTAESHRFITRTLGAFLRDMHGDDWDHTSGLAELANKMHADLDEMVDEANRLRRALGRFAETLKVMSEAATELTGAPRTAGEAVDEVVTRLIAEGQESINVDQVLSRMDYTLQVQKPPSVVSSILSRDSRLTRTSTGTFAIVRQEEPNENGATDDS